MRQGSLLPQAYDDTGWKAPEVLPVLDDRFKYVGIDCEADGFHVHGGSRTVGWGIALEDNRKFYFPTRHVGGGNLDPNVVHNWMRRELKGKHLVFAEAKFDIAMALKDGVDFEEMGCTPHEIQFRAALLDDSRRHFDLDSLGFDYTGMRKKEMDRDKIWQMPAPLVGPYGEWDPYLTLQTFFAMQPLLDKEELNDVAELEDSIIYAVLHMERSGARLDLEKLDRWCREARREYERCVYEVHRQTGIRCNPDRANDLARVFNALGITYSRTAPTDSHPNGVPSFTDKFLSSIQHPVIALIRRARTISSLDSKYLSKYRREVGADGILRYKLHQLKGDEYGTISGRFSSSSVNIQQVFARKRQIQKFGSSDFIIRELFIPDDGFIWAKADAAQIEFRLFAHYANSPRLLEAYAKNPEIDYHSIVQDLLKRRVDVDRDKSKGINFGMVYAMGRDKLAGQLGISRAEADELFDAYNAEFPEARKLVYKAMEVAEQRGYVKTYLGRRARFPKVTEAEREEGIKPRGLHSAINRVLQGTAADVMKTKIRDVYRERKNLEIHKMRFTVHDELDCDMPSIEHAKKFKKFLDEQSYEFRVPLLWEVGTGPNWAETKAA